MEEACISSVFSSAGGGGAAHNQDLQAGIC